MLCFRICFYNFDRILLENIPLPVRQELEAVSSFDPEDPLEAMSAALTNLRYSHVEVRVSYNSSTLIYVC